MGGGRIEPVIRDKMGPAESTGSFISSALLQAIRMLYTYKQENLRILFEISEAEFIHSEVTLRFFLKKIPPKIYFHIITFCTSTFANSLVPQRGKVASFQSSYLFSIKS